MKYQLDPTFSYDSNIAGFEGFDTFCTVDNPNQEARLHQNARLDIPGDRCENCGYEVAEYHHTTSK